MSDGIRKEFYKFWNKKFDGLRFTVDCSVPSGLQSVSAEELAYLVFEHQQTIIDPQQELIDVIREERDYLIDLVLGTEDRAGLLDICDNYYGPEYREDKARVEAMGMGEKYE
jgi:hypothetical protein